MSEPFFRAVIETSGVKVAGKGDIESLRQLQTDWQAAYDAMNSHTYLQARTAWLANQDEMRKASSRGKLGEHDGWSREDFEKSFEAKMEAAKLEMRRCCQEAVPIAATICEKFCTAANDLASEQERQEAAAHAKLGVPYTPSALLTALRGAPEQARRRVPTGQIYAAVSPAQLLPYLDL